MKKIVQMMKLNLNITPWTALVLRVYNQAVKPKIDVKPLQRD